MIVKKLKERGAQGLPGIDKVKATGKLPQILTLVSLYVSSAILGKIRLRDRNERLSFFTRNIGTYTRRALKLLNFEVSIVGYDAEMMQDRKFLLIGNHMSYLDIFLLSSVQPCVFVTSVDMGETFFLGDICELGGSIFVERRSRAKIERDIKVITDTLRAGHHVVIYPEGTSSNGERILPFKKSLLMSAVHAGVDVMPVVLKYTEINGEPFSLANRDKLCWYGDMAFAPHFLGLLKLRNVKAELHFLEPIKVTPESDRHEIAQRTYEAICAVYGQPLGSQDVPRSYVQNSGD